MRQFGIGSNGFNLIMEPETKVNIAALPREPERNYANDYAAYWQARSGFFTPASAVGRSRQRSGERMRPGPDT